MARNYGGGGGVARKAAADGELRRGGGLQEEERPGEGPNRPRKGRRRWWRSQLKGKLTAEEESKVAGDGNGGWGGR